ncbi:hypothetical protein GCM10027098_29850 [Bowmanella dokdonensis]
MQLSKMPSHGDPLPVVVHKDGAWSPKSRYVGILISPDQYLAHLEFYDSDALLKSTTNPLVSSE